MLQLIFACLLLISSTAFSQTQKPKYDAKALEKAIYNMGSIDDLVKFGIKSKFQQKIV
jgi:hypothetical protein